MATAQPANTWTPYAAIRAIEEECDSQDDLIEAWQYLIDTGLAWQLQGSYGRQAEAMIRNGYCWAPFQN